MEKNGEERKPVKVLLISVTSGCFGIRSNRFRRSIEVLAVYGFRIPRIVRVSVARIEADHAVNRTEMHRAGNYLAK